MGTESTQEADNQSGPVNTGFILDMQRKLYRWSRNNPKQVFRELFNWVSDPRTLTYAWMQLARNRGSRTPGVDRVTREKVEQRPGGVTAFLEEVRKALRDGTYAPAPVRAKLIPKPGKPGKFRRLGIPTLRDRLVQMCLKIVLEPIFEADFYPTSYGFRRGRSTIDALKMIQRQLEPTKKGPSPVGTIIEGDIKACFDNVNHHVLMGTLRKRIGDHKVLNLILAFLKAGVMSDGNMRHPVAGTPQGGIISPLLANVYLTGLDARYARWTPRPGESGVRASQRRSHDREKKRLPTFYVVRYADDFVLLATGTEDDSEHEKANLAQFLRDELHMELSAEKTVLTDPRQGFVFLGYRIVVEPSLRTGTPTAKLRIPKAKLQMLRDRIRKLTTRSSTRQSLEQLLKTLNPITNGWRNYYQYATGAWKDFRYLDRWMWLRVHGWLLKKHPKRTQHEIRRQYARRESPKRWTWGDRSVLLTRFGGKKQPKYICRGTRISNGWNDEMDDVSFYPEVTRPIAGFTTLGDSFGA